MYCADVSIHGEQTRKTQNNDIKNKIKTLKKDPSTTKRAQRSYLETTLGVNSSNNNHQCLLAVQCCHLDYRPINVTISIVLETLNTAGRKL